MASPNTYPINPNFNLYDFAQRLSAGMRQQGYNVQLTGFNNSFLLNISKNDDGFLKYLGMAESLKATVSVMNGQLVISYADEEWTYKIIAGVVGWFLCFVPFITAIVGAIGQLELPKKINNEALRAISSMPH